MSSAPTLRALPSVDRLMREPGVVSLAEQYSRGRVVEAAREVLGQWRQRLRRDGADGTPDLATLSREIEHHLQAATRPSLLCAEPV